MDNEENIPAYNRAFLLRLAQAQMPFGKYSGRRLIDLPEGFIIWMSRKGFPRGELGMMLAAVYEIKLNGLEYMVDSLSQ